MSKLFAAGAVFLFLCGCDKLPTDSDGFTQYVIRQGQHYADGNNYRQITGAGKYFQVRFDSSCRYTTVDPVNQMDINKLYGFSDCGNLHEENSARVGWLWNGSAIELHAYCYNNSVRSSKLLGTMAVGEVKSLGIHISGNQYIFTYENTQTTMSRYCNSASLNGYQLYPYFGGDEVAPHEMKIYIKE